MNRLVYLCLIGLYFASAAARADIFEWEYINPGDPGQGKQQSTTLCVDGAGLNAVPYSDLTYRNLTKAYLIGADLTNSYVGASDLTDADLTQANLSDADFTFATLTDANLSQANLTNAFLSDATFSGANFTGAEVRGATFSDIAAAQLYSTASYQSHDLTGIRLWGSFVGINLAGQNLTSSSFNLANLTSANLSQVNLTNASLESTTLTNANLSQANLTNAYFYGATLSGADLTGAQVQGANFENSGLTLAQLYSTASYLAHDLTGTYLGTLDLTGANFAGHNLTGASFYSATLTSANLSQANLTYVYFYAANLTNANLSQTNLTSAYFYGATLSGADLTGAQVQGAGLGNSGLTLAQLYSTASYQAHDLSGTGLGDNDFAGGNFAGQNLTSASFGGATLTGADFTDAEVRGVYFSFAIGFTPAQLYSTASYQAHDLTGIGLSESNLTGWNFAGQNLTNAIFSAADLSSADLSQANLTGADFYRAALYVTNLSQANLTNAFFGVAGLGGADLTGADARGAQSLDVSHPANTTNLIRPNGHINGLDLSAGQRLPVRDYDGNPFYAQGPIPITVDQHLSMGAGGVLRMEFDDDAWDSTISFAPGIPVALGGTLELAFADGVSLSTQIGRTFDLFDWTGVTPTGAFTVSSPYTWNLSNLYTTGEVTLAALPTISGDFNHDNTVNAADYIAWRKGVGVSSTPSNYNLWRTNFGRTAGSGAGPDLFDAAVPEPTSLASVLIVALSFFLNPRGWVAAKNRC